jgi:hypothetical protein
MLMVIFLMRFSNKRYQKFEITSITSKNRIFFICGDNKQRLIQRSTSSYGSKEIRFENIQVLWIQCPATHDL